MHTEQIGWLRPHCPIWVWDGAWLAATIVEALDGGIIIVRFSHGISAPLAVSKAAIRIPALHGTDRPSMNLSSAIYVDGLRSDCVPASTPSMLLIR
jgi:hypothetical protein